MAGNERYASITTPLGDDKLTLKKAEISEGLGKLFCFEVELISDDEEISHNDILGRNVTIELETASECRYFNGIVASFYQQDTVDRTAIYGATVRPWLWLLSLNENCRIFQRKTYPQIIKAVFDALDIADYEDKLTGSYSSQEYVVQYNETDLNFVSRIMQQEGIYYYFKHENSKHTLMLVDDYARLPDKGTVPFVDVEEPGSRIEVEGITSWQDIKHVRTGSVRLNDFDFDITTKVLEAVTSDPKVSSLSRLSRYRYPGKYTERSQGTDYTRLLMESENAQHDIKVAQGNARTLGAGDKFLLSDHFRDDQNARYVITDWQCTLLTEECFDETTPQNSRQSIFSKFRAVPATVPFRSQATAIKPRVTGPQTAIVVGKSGEEIWTDKYGRIKVQFHWDRDGTQDENSSCWIRVAQFWAGKTWGAQYTPRVGQEVLVDFLHGDPDQPVVVGSAYNGSGLPPYPLPANATKSGIKSRSSKGGGGYNEISMEDKKNEEKLSFYAQKDQEITVLNDCVETIEHDRTLSVGNDQTEEVSGQLSVTVEGDVSETFQANLTTNVTDNIEITATEFKVTADSKITLEVGGSSITIEAGGIKIKSSGTIDVEASAIATLKGSMVKIN